MTAEQPANEVCETAYAVCPDTAYSQRRNVQLSKLYSPNAAQQVMQNWISTFGQPLV